MILRHHPLISFLVLCFVISWSVVLFAAATMGVGGWETVGMAAMILVGQFGPTLASLTVIRSLAGKSGVRAYMRSTVAFKQAPWLLVFALLFYPVLFAVAVGVTVMRGAPAPDFASGQIGPLALAFFPTLALSLVFGGFSEELGWRGFLLPRLQRRIGFVGSGLVIGLLWALWHLDPEYVAAGMRGGWGTFLDLERDALQAYLSETISMSLVMAWLFNRSRGSIFLMILMHASANASVTALRLLWIEKPPLWSETVIIVQWMAALVFILASIGKSGEHLDAAEKACESA
jgi:membrane protease YdiL (CAAX protease family)